MDLSAFFSAEEMAAWAGERLISQGLTFTLLALRVLFLALLIFGGLNRHLFELCQRAAVRIEEARWLAWLGERLKTLRRLARALRRFSQGRDPRTPAPAGERQWLVDALYPVLLFWSWNLLCLPLDFFLGFVREHARGLATIGLLRWWLEWLRGQLVLALFALLLGYGLFALARRLRRSWWLWLSGAVAGALLLWSLTSPMRARLYNEYRPLPESSLRTRIQSVVTRAGLDPPRVLVVDSSKRTLRAGGYLMGQGPTLAVVLSDNLIRSFPEREIEVAVAHEVGHQLRDHPLRSLLLTGISAIIFLGLIQLVLLYGPRLSRLRLQNGADPAALPACMALLFLLVNLSSPLGAYLNRREESQADHAALELTRDPVAFASLMIRLARSNQADVDPPAWWVVWRGSHPPVRDRLRAAFEWARDNGVRLDPAALPLPAPVSAVANRPPG
ncbi:MAG: M48 family metalloprotease [Myxococcales bacterium]|nr:M48 family metalloprotease [Myxococcales bacterium]